MREVNRFTILNLTLSLGFLLIPVALWMINRFEWRPSISDFAYHTPMAFALLLTLAGALFFYDGIVKELRWYNIYVGVSLWLVVLFPHLDYPIIHYLAAGIFFIGSLFNMVFFSSGKERFLKILVSFLTIIGLAGYFVFDWYTLLVAEWIGMLPISAHFALESLGKID